MTTTKFIYKDHEPENNVALITVNPQADEAVIALYEQAVGLQRCADALTITSNEDIKSATNDLSLIKGLKDAIEILRKGYITPVKEHLESINDAFKRFTEPIIDADTVTRKKILDYRTEQERIRQEQEEINRLRIEAAQKEMELKGEISESVDIVEVVPETPNHYQAEAGISGIVKIKKWEVEDLSKVPLDYLMIDAAKVGKVVRAGIPNINGIRIWEEDNLRITRKKEG